MADIERYLGAMAAALRLGRERKRLQAIVDKLPKTADGVPIVPGRRVWQTPGDWYGVKMSMTAGPYCTTFPEWDEVYSTREAAEAAADAAKSRGKE